MDAGEEPLRSLLQALPVPMGVHAAGKVVLANGAFAELLGASDAKALEGADVMSFVAQADLGWVGERLASVYEGHPAEAATLDLVTLDGRVVPVEVTSIPMRFEGRPAALLDCRDVAQRVAAEQALRASEARWRALVEHGSDLIVVLDEKMCFTFVSPSARVILGRRPEDLIGRSAEEILHPDDLASAVAALRSRIDDPDSKHRGLRVRVRHEGSGWRWLDTFAQNLIDDPDVAGVIVNAWDVSAQVAAEAHLRHLAQHDSLTGLPNRVLLAERLDLALADGRRNGQVTGLLMLDLDRFKDVNDTLGHESGDLVLTTLAERLALAVRADDVVGRMGGDEFAVVLPDAVDAATVELVARRVLEACSAPVHHGGLQLRVGASIGMVIAPEHGDEPSLLLRRADAAMYRAKAKRGAIATASEGDLDDGRRRLESAGELRLAFERDELSCDYQPKRDLQTGAIVGVEALVRWRHPTRGFLGPDQFLVDAEHLGLMAPLTRWVLVDALRNLVRWSQAGLGLTVAVNVSAATLHDPALVAMVDEVLAVTGADPTRLVLEVTEQAAMVHPDESLAAMGALRDRGICFSIDDFGTGQSSLTYLRRLPVSEVKIDRSFIAELTDATPDAAIARSVVDLAHNLGMSAVAEGIETAEALELVRALGCDLGQGWHLGRPMAADLVPAATRSRVRG